MKLILSILIFTFLSSVISYQEGTIICVSEDSVELENPFQDCEHHTQNETESKNFIDSNDNCKDFQITNMNFHKKDNSFKLIHITKTFKYSKINLAIPFYEYKISVKDELRKKISYNKIKIYNPILKHIKTVVILT